MVSKMEQLLAHWHWVASTLALIINLGASLHVVLYKRDTRSAIGWIGVIWLTPVVGSLLYFLLGINRIRRQAYRLRARHRPLERARPPYQDPVAVFAQSFVPDESQLAPLVRLVSIVTGQPLIPGNCVLPYQNGDQAYLAMIQAIHEARHSVSLSTYIFANDRAGELFVGAFRQAVARGIEVRILIDGIGVHYSWPSILGPLRRSGVPVALFLPSLLPWHFQYANMRSHRKIMVVDGEIGFTGGMNFSAQNYLSQSLRNPIQDMHFKIEGPAVGSLQDVFADDWAFTAGERLQGERWFPELEERGPVLARGITSGPDANFEKLRLIYLGALACARTCVRIVTPYFLPDSALIAALNTAALRGVQVDILLPGQNNLRLVQWASTPLLTEVLEHGCRVWLTPPPFDHTKLVLVDRVWAFLGSANWDPRSLQLNFEFNLECYDRKLAGELETVVLRKLEYARPVTPADLNHRSLPVKLRDGIARLLTPYL
jgi:cardiolipin synthase A/B